MRPLPHGQNRPALRFQKSRCGMGAVLGFLARRQTAISISRMRTPVFALALLAFSSLSARATGADPVGSTSTNWTAADDHKNMMQQLGIKALRPGPSGRSGATNEANYDPAKANPFPNL